MHTYLPPTSAFAVGEEVIAVLDGIEVYDIDQDGVVPAKYRPAWTIAMVVGLTQTPESRAYILRFGIGDNACICVAPERAIEGTA